MQMKPQYTDEQLVQIEVAAEILTSAQAIISERLHQIGPNDPAETARLETKAKEIHVLQRSLHVSDDAGIKAIVDTWGPRVKSEKRFWREL